MKKTSKNISFALRQLLLEGKVGTQEAVCKALEKQGFSVNQSKVSRLLSKIGAIKISDPQGNNIYRLPHEHGLAHELHHPGATVSAQNWVLDVVSNEILIVIHTMPGAAALVARDLDLHHVDLNILGCIAGDDTIFVAPKEIKQIKPVVEKIKMLLSKS